MARTVYPTREVCHLWANRFPHAIRNAGGNVSAASGRLYSYGSHFIIGAFLDAPAKGGVSLLLWNAENYSSTTARHKSHAWHALSNTQRQNVCRVPGLSDSTLRDIPALAAACVKAAVQPLEKSRKARENRPGYLSDAARWFDSARRLYLYAGDAKAAAAVPTLESRDADKETVETILRGINRAEYVAKAAHYRADAARVLADAENRAAAHRAGDVFAGTYARDIVQLCQNSKTHSSAAVDMYKRAGVNVPPLARQLHARAERLIVEFSPVALAETLAIERADIEKSRDCIVSTMATMKRTRRGQSEGYKILKSGRRVNYGNVYTLDRWMSERVGGPFGFALAQSAPQLWPDEKERAAKVAELAAIDSRARRILAAHKLAKAIQDTADTCAEYQRDVQAGARSYYLPGSRTVRDALQAWAKCGDVPAFWRDKAETVAALADTIRAEHAARKAAENAEKIEAWRRGERVSLPGDVPTMARIVGENVETSRGASVPLAHAARLVRLAERVAASGGQSWPDGTGPQVGHYRVNAIGPDMSAVIGCHEFSADESRRAVALIKAAAQVETV